MLKVRMSCLSIRTPKDIDTLKEQMPDVHQQFVNVTKQLETHYKDLQDIEFTIENGRLWPITNVMK